MPHVQDLFMPCAVNNVSGIDSDEIIVRINHMFDEKFRIEHTTIQAEFENLCIGHSSECCGI